MCGIVGYIGEKNARDIIIKGLKELEYRGYDSAGIALYDYKNKDIKLFKESGRITKLEKIIDYSFETKFGIGHTRWATHGRPNYVNSHPHVSMNKRFIIVHNGVINNYKKIKVQKLSGYTFVSETDTEVIANLIEYYSNDLSTIDSIKKTISELEGSYALLIIDTQDYNHLYVAKNKSPLLVGFNEDGITVASDFIALDSSSNEYCSLEDQTIGIISKTGADFYDILGYKKDVEHKKIIPSDINQGKGNYEHYMLKEIEEQPFIIRRILSKYYDGSNVIIDDNLIAAIKNSDKINFVACGTSMYACYMAKYYMEKLCNIPSEVFCASELVYSQPLMTKKPFYIFLSQSGETADSISVMTKCKKMNYPILAITNSIGSTMVRLADYHLPLYAGKEIAVASTKAYTAQIVVCAILTKEVSGTKTNLRNNLVRVSHVIEEILSNKEIYKDIASNLIKSNDCFYIGRGIDYWVSLEAALKLKEISYIHTEAYSSGELKHGPIALIKEGVPVIAIITQEGTNMITRSNLMETIARGAKHYIISMESMSMNDDDVIIPNVAHYLTPLVSVVVCQLIAYYSAILKGNDVDKPRNLAKSVTVE